MNKCPDWVGRVYSCFNASSSLCFLRCSLCVCLRLIRPSPDIVTMAANEDNIKLLRFRLEEAAIKCSDRGLYQSAKWYVR